MVSAEGHTDVPGDEAWAGIGWIQDNEIGHGLLVEHEGHSEAEMRADIEASLGSLRQGRGHVGDRLGDVQLVTHGTPCTEGPVCSIVVAAFSTESWAPASSRWLVAPGVGALWPMRLGPMRLGLHG